jgi:nucleotide-binding universal stress UspA family protein
MTVVAVYTPDREGAAALVHSVHEAELRQTSLVVIGMPTANRSPEAESVLAEARLLAERAGLEVQLQDRDDRDLADQVIDASYEDDVAAVVVGTRRRSPVGKMLLGGIAQQVVLEAHCPVVVVKLPAGPQGTPRRQS